MKISLKINHETGKPYMSLARKIEGGEEIHESLEDPEYPRGCNCFYVRRDGGNKCAYCTDKNKDSWGEWQEF